MKDLQEKCNLLIKECNEIIKNKDEYIALNKHWKNYHLENWTQLSSIIFTDISEIFLEQKRKLQKFTISIWDAFVNETIPKNKIEYYISLDSILESIENWEKIMILTNHVNFWWIPLIIRELKKRAKETWKENLDWKINTIVWMALTTSNQKHFIQSMTNLLVTIPNSRKFDWKIEWVSESSIKKARIWFIKNFRKIFQKEEWQIVIMAPTWTRDELARATWISKDVICVLFESDEDVQSSLWLAKMAEKSWAKIALWWMNESWIQKPWEKWNNWQKSNIFTDLKILEENEFEKLNAEWKIMEEIAKLVVDEKWNSIWKTAKQSDLIDFWKWKKSIEEIFDKKEIENLFLQRSKINPLQNPLSEKQIKQIYNWEKISEIIFWEDILRISEYLSEKNIFWIKISQSEKYDIFSWRLTFTDIFRWKEECFENFIYKFLEKHWKEKNIFEKMKNEIVLWIFKIMKNVL